MLWNRLEDDGTYHMTNWTLPRLLAILNDAPFTDEQALWPPTGIWRCVEIRPDQDDEHTTHQNCVHSAANTWLYNNAVVDDQTGDRTYLADTLTGWDWAGRGWRTVSKFDRPSDIIAMADANRFFFAAHNHFHARDSIGQSWQLAPGTAARNEGTHGSRYPSAFLDGHASSAPLTADYWFDRAQTYTPPLGAVYATSLYDQEVRRLIWFIRAR